MNLIRVADSCVDEVETNVGAVTFLFDHGHVLPQGLLGILQLMFEAFNVLLVHHLRVRLFEGHLSPQILHFAIRLGLDP